MPATSAKQARYMQGCLHNPSKMRGKCPSKTVAKEFNHVKMFRGLSSRKVR